MGLFGSKRSGGYTIIKRRHGGELDEALLNAFKYNDVIGTKIDLQKEDGVIISIAVKTKLLKQAIKTDDAVSKTLEVLDLEMVDLLKPLPLKLSGPRIADPLPSRVYVKSVLRGEETAHIRKAKNVDEAKRNLEDIARWIPAAILVSLVGGVIYMGVRTANIAVDTIEKAADQNKRMADVKTHGKDGLSEVLEERSGHTPAKPASQPASFQQAENQRRATPTTQTRRQN